MHRENRQKTAAGYAAFWSPMLTPRGSSATPVESVKSVKANASSSSPGKGHNLRYAQFLALHEALCAVGNLPPDSGLFLPQDVVVRARDMLGLISANFKIEPPKFFPQEGEAAVFTWDDGKLKRLLTIDSEEADYMAVDKESFISCRHDVPASPPLSIGFFLKELGSLSTSAGTTEQDA